MNNRRAIVLATAVVIAAGIIVVMTLRGFASRSPAPVANAADAPIDSPIAAAPAAASPPAATETPPWARAQATDIEPTAAPEAAADPQRARQMQQLQHAMRGIMTEASRRSDATNDHLRKALDTLQEMNDPAVTSQVNLDAVRHNLEISIKMQDLAQELQQVMAEPGSPARQQRLDATLQQFRRLQSQLRQDVRAPGATVDLPTFPTAAPAATP
ncbi:MAG: hypothetical protein ACREPV_03455 [Lysobacter sp.]